MGAHLHPAPSRRDAARAQLLRQHEEDPPAAAAGDVLHRKEVWTAAATKTDWKRTALSGVKPTIVGTCDTFPALMIRVSVERFSMPLNWYIAEGKGERKGTFLKTLFSVAFLWAPWSKLSAYWNIRHESTQHRADLLRETAEGREVQSYQCFKLFLSLLAPWKSAPTLSGNSTLEKARQYHLPGNPFVPWLRIVEFAECVQQTWMKIRWLYCLAKINSFESPACRWRWCRKILLSEFMWRLQYCEPFLEKLWELRSTEWIACLEDI